MGKIEKKVSAAKAAPKETNPNKVKVSITMTDNEKRLIKLLAERKEVSVSDFIVDNLLISYLTHEKQEFADMAKDHNQLIESVIIGRM